MFGNDTCSKESVVRVKSIGLPIVACEPSQLPDAQPRSPPATQPAALALRVRLVGSLSKDQSDEQGSQTEPRSKKQAGAKYEALAPLPRSFKDFDASRVGQCFTVSFVW